MNTQTAETTTIDAAEEMGQVADLIAAGATREARRRTARLADTATVSTRALLGEILAALETHPAVTIAKLRDLWKVSDEDGRALVLACVPHAERRAEAAKQAARDALGREIVTPILGDASFYPADAYHQDYYKSAERLAVSSVGLFVPKSEAYKRYREGCGRDATVKALWGSEAPFAK